MDYQSLVNEQAASMGVSPLPVEEQSFGSAATDLSKIFINPSFAERVHSTSGLDGLRFVLAHELGHARGNAGGGHSGEHAADRWAAQSVAKMGVGFEAITGVMGHLNQAATDSHPGAGDRVNQARDAYAQSVEKDAREVAVEKSARPLARASEMRAQPR
jgi:hypothetical protein